METANPSHVIRIQKHLRGFLTRKKLLASNEVYNQMHFKKLVRTLDDHFQISHFYSVVEETPFETSGKQAPSPQDPEFIQGSKGKDKKSPSSSDRNDFSPCRTPEGENLPGDAKASLSDKFEASSSFAYGELPRFASDRPENLRIVSVELAEKVVVDAEELYEDLPMNTESFIIIVEDFIERKVICLKQKVSCSTFDVMFLETYEYSVKYAKPCCDIAIVHGLGGRYAPKMHKVQDESHLLEAFGKRLSADSGINGKKNGHSDSFHQGLQPKSFKKSATLMQGKKTLDKGGYDEVEEPLEMKNDEKLKDEKKIESFNNYNSKKTGAREENTEFIPLEIFESGQDENNLELNETSFEQSLKSSEGEKVDVKNSEKLEPESKSGEYGLKNSRTDNKELIDEGYMKLQHDKVDSNNLKTQSVKENLRDSISNKIDSVNSSDSENSRIMKLPLKKPEEENTADKKLVNSPKNNDFSTLPEKLVPANPNSENTEQLLDSQETKPKKKNLNSENFPKSEKIQINQANDSKNFTPKISSVGEPKDSKKSSDSSFSLEVQNTSNQVLIKAKSSQFFSKPKAQAPNIETSPTSSQLPGSEPLEQQSFPPRPNLEIQVLPFEFIFFKQASNSKALENLDSKFNLKYKKKLKNKFYPYEKWAQVLPSINVSRPVYSSYKDYGFLSDQKKREKVFQENNVRMASSTSGKNIVKFRRSLPKFSSYKIPIVEKNDKVLKNVKINQDIEKNIRISKMKKGRINDLLYK